MGVRPDCVTLFAMGVFYRYTDQAKRAIYFAKREAVHRNQEAITPRDILMGLTWEEDTRADRIGHLKNRATEARAAVELPYLPNSATPYQSLHTIPLSREGKLLLAFAVQEAQRSHDFWIDTDHLLRALLRLEDHVASGGNNGMSRANNDASDAIRALQLDLNALRDASVVDRKTNPPASISLKLKIHYLGQRYRWAFLLVAVGLLILLLRLRDPV